MSKPKVSVIMPVYNGEEFLRPAIESILRQTYKDFELLIIDDASTDNTPDILAEFQDQRITVLHNNSNLGEGGARNIGLQHATGEIIANLDADDIAYPERLAKQIEYLNTHPDVVLLGSAAELIDETGQTIDQYIPPTDPAVMGWILLFRNRIIHSSVIYRHAPVMLCGGYDKELRVAGDFDLWSKLAMSYKVSQLSQILVQYRINSSGLMRKNDALLKRCTYDLILRNMERVLHRPISLDAARCLSGESVSSIAGKEALEVIKDCINWYIHKRYYSLEEKRRLFFILLKDLWQVIYQNKTDRLQAIKILVSYGLKYSPSSFISFQFFIFCGRLVLPNQIRRWFRKYLPTQGD